MMKKYLLTIFFFLSLCTVSFADFPTTGILDNFNRADENPLGANWTTAGGDGLRLVSNQVRNVTPNAATAIERWNVATYGADVEIYITLATSGTVDDLQLYWRVDTSLHSGYVVKISDFADTIKIYEIAAGGTHTQLGATISQAVSNGDSYGISHVGSTITVYRKPAAGSWTSLGTRTDNTHAAAGYLAVGFWEAPGTTRIDDFGGGTVVSAGARSRML